MGGEDVQGAPLKSATSSPEVERHVADPTALNTSNNEEQTVYAADADEKQGAPEYPSSLRVPPGQRPRTHSPSEAVPNEPPVAYYLPPTPHTRSKGHSAQVLGNNAGQSAGMVIGAMSGNMVGDMLVGQEVGGFIGQQIGRAEMREQSRQYRGAIAAGVPREVAAIQAGLITDNGSRAGRAERRMKRWDRREKRHEKFKGLFASGHQSE